MIDWLPWWAWAVPLGGAVLLVWHFLGTKGAIGAALAGVLALFGARARQKGYDERREEELNEYVETRKRTDGVHYPDADAARRAMHERRAHKR